MTKDEERFWSKVNKRGPFPRHAKHLGRCYVWTASIKRPGYAQFWIDGKMTLGHHVAWKFSEGSMPPGPLLHRCDNRACVRRSHLRTGTQLQNIADRESKGRGVVVAVCGSRHYRAKLTEAKVRRILRLIDAGLPQPKIAKMFNVSRTAIGGIATGKNWKHVRFGKQGPVRHAGGTIVRLYKEARK